MKTMLLESEMEKYLIDKGYDITDGEVTDSTVVVDIAIELGFELYTLNGEGQELNETLVFIKHKK